MRIGSYQVLFELGRGGMGAVYLARSIGPGGVERLVAIKRARAPARPGVGRGDRFLDEVRVTAHIHHANVVGMHQAGSDDQGHYLVFDYVEGESLDGLVTRAAARGERLPVRIVLRVVLDALAGLHAAHETTDTAGRALGILHRDVSTHNLLVGRDGVTRLADFGIAKSTVSTAVTEQGHVEGKLVYMAPEYVQQLPVDRTVDVYAMGVTLWVALAGREPWSGGHPGQILTSILLQGVPALRSVGIEVAPELEAIALRASSRDAGLRFQSARQMLDELEAAGRRLDSIASHVEVSEYVETVVGRELAARREAIEVGRAELERPAPPSSAANPPPAPRTSSEPAAGSATGELVHNWEKPLPWRGAALAGAALALLVIIFTLFSNRAPREPEPSTTPDSVSSSLPSAGASAELSGAGRSPSPPVGLAADPGTLSSGAPAFTVREQPRPARTPSRSAPKASAPSTRGKLDGISTANPYAE